MVVDLELVPTLSWKEKLLGIVRDSRREIFGIEMDEEDDFVSAEGDITSSFVNGIPSINFFDKVNQFLIKDMANIMVINLLRRNIGYVALQNKVYSLWKPSKPFQMMDIENDYFLAKFQKSDDFERVLSQVPWIIYGQYLTVKPWSIEFDLAQPFPSVVMPWINFPGLPGYM
ncbi:hypothetical protein Golax_024061 [Gossypium laxum]|uniref:DUF4283 domain-containing protein n=1 Tax=Gossypium laxum TaxID=34288 RepID=A0A7J8ZAX1_9ROSI|nr:hypothetical protein [Gossypium laxum]